ncbi:unnamed protein product [Amoebophrya sp. A120]|nr:unnamed protein product [Amoebophrya sp. A120]|eukprot:GSA120T00024912001.1
MFPAAPRLFYHRHPGFFLVPCLLFSGANFGSSSAVHDEHFPGQGRSQSYQRPQLIGLRNRSRSPRASSRLVSPVVEETDAGPPTSAGEIPTSEHAQEQHQNDVPAPPSSAIPTAPRPSSSTSSPRRFLRRLRFRNFRDRLLQLARPLGEDCVQVADPTCMICLDDLAPGSFVNNCDNRPVAHCYHRKCWETFLGSRSPVLDRARCPVCREWSGEDEYNFFELRRSGVFLPRGYWDSENGSIVSTSEPFDLLVRFCSRLYSGGTPAEIAARRFERQVAEEVEYLEGRPWMAMWSSPCARRHYSTGAGRAGGGNGVDTANGQPFHNYVGATPTVRRSMLGGVVGEDSGQQSSGGSSSRFLRTRFMRGVQALCCRRRRHLLARRRGASRHEGNQDESDQDHVDLRDRRCNYSRLQKLAQKGAFLIIGAGLVSNAVTATARETEDHLQGLPGKTPLTRPQQCGVLLYHLARGLAASGTGIFVADLVRKCRPSTYYSCPPFRTTTRAARTTSGPVFMLFTTSTSHQGTGTRNLLYEEP